MRRLTREERAGVGRVILARKGAKSLEYLVDVPDQPLIERNIRAVASISGLLLCRMMAAASGWELELGAVKDRPLSKAGVGLLALYGPVSRKRRRMVKRILPGLVRGWPDGDAVLPQGLSPRELADIMPLLLLWAVGSADALGSLSLWSIERIHSDWMEATGRYEDVSGDW
jgi:hypothetical protein